MRIPSLSLLILTSLAIVACAPAAPTDTTGADAVIVSWTLREEEPGEYDMPRTTVSLTLEGAADNSVFLGTFPGTFADGRTMSVPQDPDAILSGMLWWAGGGDELQLKRTAPGTLTVLHRGVDEQQETPAEFAELAVIEIPAKAAVEAAPYREPAMSAPSSAAMSAAMTH